MEARLSSKIRVLPSGRLSETLDSGKFRHRMAIVTVCFSRSSTNVDAQRDKLDRRWSTKLTILAMVDGCCSPVSEAAGRAGYLRRLTLFAIHPEIRSNSVSSAENNLLCCYPHNKTMLCVLCIIISTVSNTSVNAQTCRLE